MVQDPDIEERQRLFQSLCDPPVGTARLRDARGVIMGKNDRPGTQLQGPSDNLPGVHCGTVKGAEEQVLTAQYTVLTVEKQATEHLPFMGSQMILEKSPGIL